ncbi:hypothetical protein CAPTEDRAFT_166600 [Capitella teleta]|uniref:Organic cation transporter-like protein 2 n=1 Tax=Capitella teleta TaxID=283909 RepID=R7V2B5_CAPTE|nr:hypothetical protein CAPTEDRAFT_166600 [Capitella teleta]|eukprot:ELU12622.1 hypothetical protein CAPTEDRAFT_166600 [Capitella teleta]
MKLRPLPLDLPKEGDNGSDDDNSVTQENAATSDENSEGDKSPPAKVTEPLLSPKDDFSVSFRTVRIGGRSFKVTSIITHLNICLYATCFWIQIGALPYLTKKLGLDPVFFGYLQTTFAVVQLCGGPLFGRFGDIYGARAAMVLAFVSASLSYSILGFADSTFLLFLSRFPSVFMHAMQAGQMVITDTTESRSRAEAMGFLGLSYGIGMVVGPFVGGLITKGFDEQHAAFVACAGSFASIALSLYFIPSVTKKTKAETKSTSQIFNLSRLLAVVKHPDAISLLIVKFISGIPIGVFQSMFAVIAMDTFKLAPDENGFLMSYVGVLTMITQGIGIGFLAKRTTEFGSIKLGAFILIWTYILLSFVSTVWQLCVVLIPLCMGLTLMNVVISSALTNTVPESDTGTILGVNMAVNSLIRSMSPTIGGIMFNHIGFASFGYLGTVGSVLTTLFLLSRNRKAT